MKMRRRHSTVLSVALLKCLCCIVSVPIYLLSRFARLCVTGVQCPQRKA